MHYALWTLFYAHSFKPILYASWPMHSANLIFILIHLIPIQFHSMHFMLNVLCFASHHMHYIILCWKYWRPTKWGGVKICFDVSVTYKHYWLLINKKLWDIYAFCTSWNSFGTDQPTDRPTNRPTNRPTDRQRRSYRFLQI